MHVNGLVNTTQMCFLSTDHPSMHPAWCAVGCWFTLALLTRMCLSFHEQLEGDHMTPIQLMIPLHMLT